MQLNIFKNISKLLTEEPVELATYLWLFYNHHKELHTEEKKPCQPLNIEYCVLCSIKICLQTSESRCHGS